MKNYVVHQLLQTTLIEHPDQEIVSGKHRFTYAQFYHRVLKLANCAKKIGS